MTGYACIFYSGTSGFGVYCVSALLAMRQQITAGSSLLLAVDLTGVKLTGVKHRDHWIYQLEGFDLFVIYQYLDIIFSPVLAVCLCLF